VTDSKSEVVKEYLSKIATELEKLNREVRNLRVDVLNLTGRIEPFEGQPDLKTDLEFVRRLGPKNFQQALDMIYETRESVRNAEGHTAKAASLLESISEDVVSREEMKKWLVPATRRPKKP